MRASIRQLHSPDIADLEAYQPPERDCFGFLLQMLIGPEGGPGQESFDVIVCTPRWISETYGWDEIVIGRHMIIVFEYNFARLSAFLDRKVSQVAGDSWENLAHQLGRLGRWEFEDYREST